MENTVSPQMSLTLKTFLNISLQNRKKFHWKVLFLDRGTFN